MHYLEYVTGVERRRTVLKSQLETANTLRREAHLPLRNVDQAVTEQEPLLSKDEFDARSKEQAGFNRFRREKLAVLGLPKLAKATDWQDHRALAFRRLFLERQIQKAWQDQELVKPT